jgi:hypothetical protein
MVMSTISNACKSLVDISPGTCSRTRTISFLGTVTVPWIVGGNNGLEENLSRATEWVITKHIIDQYSGLYTSAALEHIKEELREEW